MTSEVEERLSAELRLRAAESKTLPGVEALIRRERRRRAARISGALVAAVLTVSVPLWSLVQPGTVQFADPLPNSAPAGHWERVRADDGEFGRLGEASEIGGMATVDDRFVAVGMGGGSDDGRTDAAVWVSDDGRSWRHTTSTGAWFAEGIRPDGAVLLSDVTTVDEETLVAVGYINFEPRHAPLAVRSSDGGQTWSAAASFVDLYETVSADLSRIAVAPDGTLFALGGWSDDPPSYSADLPAIWSSTAGGDWQRASWGDIPEPTLRGWQLSDLAISDVGRVAVGSSADGALVVRATSEGAWEQEVVVEEPDAVLSAVTATDDGFIAVGVAGGSDGGGLVVRSDADGQRWERIDDAEVLGGADLSAVTVDAQGRLVVGGTEEGASAVWTHDGRAWHHEPGDWHPGGITALAASGQGLVAGGYAADDGGSQDAAVWIHRTGRTTPGAAPKERIDELIESPGATLLLSTDHSLTVIDLERGTSERVRLDELAGGDPPYRLTQRGDAVVFFGEDGDTYAATPSALEEPWRLGSSSYYLPSAEPDRVWLVEGDASTQARNEVREVAVDGRITMESRPVPSGTIPQGAVADGLVLFDGSGLQVWDPRSDRIVAEFPGPSLVAAHGDLLAWCDLACEDLHISDLAAGTQVQVDAPRDDLAWSSQGAFAPSGDRLAVPLGSGGPESAELAVIDLDGSVHLLDDTPIAGTPITWDPHGRWLFAATEDGSLLVHDVEKDQTQLLDLDLPAFYGIAVDAVASLGHFAAEQAPRGGQLEDGLVLSAGGFDSGEVRAVEEGTGRALWTFDAGDTAFLGPRVDDLVLVAPDYGGLFAVDLASGEQRWSVTLDSGESAGTPAIADDTAYLPTSYPGEGDTTAPRLHAIDLHTGERRWVTSLEPGTDLQWHQPVITEELVLLTDTLSHPGSAPTSWLHAIDRATGSIAWRFDLDDDEQGFHFQEPLTDADTVYVVSSRGLFAIDLRTGEQRWARTAQRMPELFELTAERLTIVLDGTRQELDPSTGKSIDDKQAP